MPYKKTKSGKRQRVGGSSGLTRKRKTRYSNTSNKKAKTTKKRTTKKTTKRISPHTAAYVNPFSSLTSQPKIPDGKASESVGLTFRNISEVNAGSSTAPTTFLLVPALGYGVAIANDSESLANFSSASNAINLRKFNAAPGTFAFSSALTGIVPAKTLIQMDKQAIAHWRLVSMGMRISLLNNVESDDGWFEASQLVYDDTTDDWKITPFRALAGFDSTHMLAPTGQMQQVVNEDLSNERTFKTGLLRDLHKYVWRCAPCKEDHDFIDLHGSYYTATDEALVNTTDKVMSFESGAITPKSIIKEVIDSSFQMVVVRCHGRGPTNNPSRYHVDSQGNYEFIYANDSSMSKFHTTGAHDSSFDNVSTNYRLQGGTADMVTS